MSVLKLLAGADFPNTSFFDTPTVFESAHTTDIAITFDSTNNKIVIVYRDVGNSLYGTAVVGTVSGTSISFGTPVVFNSATTGECGVSFDTSTGKVVIAYNNAASNYRCYAIVGTVSGTSISFGTATDVTGSPSGANNCNVVFDSANNKVVVIFSNSGFWGRGTAAVGTVSGTSISFGALVVFDGVNDSTQHISAAFDSTNNKVVVSYQDGGNSNYGTVVVGTVSGTSISFGTPVVFESATTTYTATAFDSTNSKVVISYTDGGNSNYGTAIVGTVSGTSISFGSPVVFETSSVADISATFDSTIDKVVLAYRDVGNSNYGTFVVGAVSGTSISFGSPVVFESGDCRSESLTFDSANNKVVLAYRDVGNSNYGTSRVGDMV
jgi:hypothetical protein